MRAHAVRLASLAAAVSLAVLLAGCGDDAQDDNTDPKQVDSVEVPQLGACRVLTPEDVGQPSNATKVVDCEDKHTSETFAVGPLPPELQGAEYDGQELGAFAYQTCSQKFQKFLGADESTVMRTIVRLSLIHI